jgi:hypothetical protein
MFVLAQAANATTRIHVLCMAFSVQSPEASIVLSLISLPCS